MACTTQSTVNSLSFFVLFFCLLIWPNDRTDHHHHLELFHSVVAKAATSGLNPPR